MSLRSSVCAHVCEAPISVTTPPVEPPVSDPSPSPPSPAAVHELYLGVLLRRCLLSGPAERTLHAAVLSALQLAGRLRQLWTAAGQLPETELLKLEGDYVRCHHFTAGLLRQYRQSMGHGEW